MAASHSSSDADGRFMRRALALARRGYGTTSPNPMVGAVIVRNGEIIGEGWHHVAGGPHAEVEAIADAKRRGIRTRDATIYVTLEPCSTHGRTPPCTGAIQAAGLKRVVVGATDPNPAHAGAGLKLLEESGIKVTVGILAEECAALNEAFNHWIVERTPFVTLKAAMTLDGKIATHTGQSKWITSEKARAHVMKLRRGMDAILIGSETLLADDPSLTIRTPKGALRKGRQPLRIILDSRARTPQTAKVVSDEFAANTIVVVGESAPKKRKAALAEKVRVLEAPLEAKHIDLNWLVAELGKQNVTSLLIEGGGVVNAAFLEQGLAHRVAFYYGPKIIGGKDARPGIAGTGATGWQDIVRLNEVSWRQLGPDLFMTGRIQKPE